MSPGNASSTVVRWAPNTDWAYLVANGRPVAACVSTMPRSKRPEQTRTNAMRSRCARSMPACTLNTSAGERRDERPRVAVGVLAGFGGGREVDQRVQEAPDPDPLQRRAEQDGGGDARDEVLLVEPGADLGQQRQLVRGAPPRVRLLGGGLVRRHDLDLAAGGAAGRARVAAQLAGLHLQHAAQVARDAERPGDRHGPQPDRLLHLVEQLEGFAAGAVPLVDERQHGDLAGAADVEQLERLRLEALRGVEQHHGGVDRGEHPVGVLGEVARGPACRAG